MSVAAGRGRWRSGVAVLVLLTLTAGACDRGSSNGENESARAPDRTATSEPASNPPVSTTLGKANPVVKKDEMVTVPSDVLFGFDSDRLSADAEGLLAAALELARRLPTATLAVDGHTDSVGGAAYNQDLSRRRAASVVQWMTAHGVDAKRMSARGFGAERPVADNNTPEGRQMNRRVEITVVAKS